MLQKAGSYSPARLWQSHKFSDVSDLQSPMDGGRAVMMTSGVAWVLQRAGFYLPSSDGQSKRLRVWSFDRFPISFGNAEMVMTSNIVAWMLQRAGSYSPVMAVSPRFRFSKFCSVLISSGIAENITLSVAWVLHRAGFYSPARLRQ